jgi:hypothetical protein
MKMGFVLWALVFGRVAVVEWRQLAKTMPKIKDQRPKYKDLNTNLERT